MSESREGRVGHTWSGAAPRRVLMGVPCDDDDLNEAGCFAVVSKLNIALKYYKKTTNAFKIFSRRKKISSEGVNQ